MVDDPYLHVVLNQRYRLDESLGGRFGRVYRANGPTGPVCLRLFGPDDPDRTALLEDYEAVVNLQVSATLPWLELGRATTGPAAGHVFVVAPYGETLAARGRLEAAELQSLTRSVASALFDLHERGRVYAKLTPHNVIYYQGTWWLADRDALRGGDWLPAWLADADPAWVSAELWRRQTVPQADMWSLGMLLLHALTGAGLGTLFETTAGRFPTLPSLPSPFDLIVRGCLAAEPGRRWSAANVLQALDGLPVVHDTSWRSPYTLDASSPVATPLAGGKRLEGHMSEVRSVAFSPTEDVLVSGALDGGIHVWTLSTGRFKRIGAHSAAIRRLKYTPDGRFLVSACREGEVRVWDGPTVIATERLSCPVLDLFGDSESALVLTDDGTLYRWRWPEPAQRLEGLPQAISIYGGRHGRLDGRILEGTRPVQAMTGPVMALTPTWAVALDGVVRCVDGRAHTFPTDLWCGAEHGDQAAAAGHNRLVYVWSGATAPQALKGHTLGITDLAFSRDGHLLASACKDRKIILWDRRPD